jgi:hypothetical protein
VKIMVRYLVVAHQTAATPELLSKLRELATGQPKAEFVVLVPATPIPHLLAWVEGEALEVAKRSAELAKGRMEEMGITVSRTAVGDGSPLVAIGDELRQHPEHYDAIIISTLPLGVSRWLGLDLPHQAGRKFHVPVIHVVSEVKPDEVRSST